MQAGFDTICLNPHCTAPRLFTAQSLAHQECRGWRTGFHAIYLEATPRRDFLVDSVKISFQRQPIQQINQLLSLTSWPHQIECIFEELRQSIGLAIDQLRESTVQEFRTHFLAAQAAKKCIRDYIQGQDRRQERLSPLWQLLDRGSVRILEKEYLTTTYCKGLLPMLSKLKEHVQSFKLEDTKQLTALEKFHQFFDNEQMHSNEKIQKLANAFNCEMVKSNYDQLSARYRTECFLCQIEIFSSNKKTGALEALLDHIKTIHSEQVKSSFIPSVMGYSAFEVNAAELVQEVFLKRPAMVWIIDRENAGQIEKPPMFTNDHLWVEVVNKNNKNLAKGRFLAASSNKKDAADILISILVANLLSQTDAEVKLITKDHFGEVLEEITKSLHDHRMRSLEPNAIMGFQGQE